MSPKKFPAVIATVKCLGCGRIITMRIGSRVGFTDPKEPTHTYNVARESASCWTAGCFWNYMATLHVAGGLQITAVSPKGNRVPLRENVHWRIQWRGD